MIRNSTKRRLLIELEKSGNIYVSCLKLGINRATFYRWRQENKEFRKKADRATQDGRANNCDIAEHSLMRKVKDGNMEAIKYILGHNSTKYKSSKTNKVILEHVTKNKDQELNEEERARTEHHIALLNQLIDQVKSK